MKYIFFIEIILLFTNSCSGNKIISLEPDGLEKFKALTIKAGDLKAVFIDNTELPPTHRAGYNGIAELYHSCQDSTIFVPAYAGFNLEHIFNGDSLIQFFEPRINPMTLFRKSENEVLLHQKSTPVSGVESLIEFRLVEPCFIDITFRCIFHDKQYLRHNFIGLFWASYINNPPDRNIYFRGIAEDQPSDIWISAFSEKHGTKSTHRAINDEYELFFSPDFRASLANNYSDYRYTKPFYFGRFHNMVLAFLFKSSEIIRLTQSPTGGGNNNPAWDFQYIIHNPKIGKEYSFKAKMIYKPYKGDQDILEEYEIWSRNN